MLPTLSRTDSALNSRRPTPLRRTRAIFAGVVQGRLGVGAVVVAGTSMAPTLLPGDCLLVRRDAPVRPGDLVVAERPDRPGLLLVKRAAHPVGDRWWLVGDNPAASDDSRFFGPVRPVARVLFRYWPPLRYRAPRRRS